jgi:hypothetical protein
MRILRATATLAILCPRRLGIRSKGGPQGAAAGRRHLDRLDERPIWRGAGAQASVWWWPRWFGATRLALPYIGARGGGAGGLRGHATAHYGPGQRGRAGRCGARRGGVHAWGRCRTPREGSGGLELQGGEGVVGASGELARDAEDGALSAASPLDREVEGVVGDYAAGRRGGRPRPTPTAAAASPAWSGGRRRLVSAYSDTAGSTPAMRTT